MIEKQPERMTMTKLMQKHGAVLCLTTADGFANIEFDDAGKFIVKLLNEEGYVSDESEWEVQTVIKVADFLRDLLEMKLENYSIKK